MKFLKKALLGMLFLVILSWGAQVSQADDAHPNASADAPSRMVHPESRQAAHHDVSPPLRSIRPIKPAAQPQRRFMHNHKINRQSSNQAPSAPAAAPTDAGSPR